MMQMIFRFLVGGIVVSLFSVLADMVKPKSFAGLLGAAPSVALATLGLTMFKEGRLYAAQESRSMLVGAAAFFVYSCLCMRLLAKQDRSATLVTVGSLALWLACSLGIWLAVLK